MENLTDARLGNLIGSLQKDRSKHIDSYDIKNNQYYGRSSF
jgi:hypothetical protein